MTAAGQFEVTTARAADLATMVGWAAAEGWNPGRGDAEPFLAADRQGFLIGRLDGAPIGCISVVRYGADFGFLGFYIVAPDHRGRGFGMRIWDAGMAHLTGRTVGLDGVVAQQANYAKSGFVLAHRNVRYAGRVAVAGSVDPRVVSVDAALATVVVAYDRPLFPADRGAFLSRWLDGSGGRVALAFVEDGAVCGYGVIRPAEAGFKIGPLFADTAAIAEALFLALAARAEGDAVVLDPPEPNAAAVALAVRHGLQPVFETARMYRGRTPELDLDRIYGITSFELG